MVYYHVQMSEDTINLCMILIKWGKYRYNHLPMGVRNLPDIFQQKINIYMHTFVFYKS